MRNKLIIIFTLLFFVSSASFLAWSEKKQSDENYKKDWWSTYFIQPKTANFSFIIENHSNSSLFEWKVLNNKKILQEGKEDIQKGEKKEIFLADNFNSGKIIIQVRLGNETKEIYKNF